MPSTVIPALLKLREMSSMNVCVVLISDLLWDRYYHGKMRFCKPTISIFFPQYSKSNLFGMVCGCKINTQNFRAMFGNYLQEETRGS
jgi:hypothetical protein